LPNLHLINGVTEASRGVAINFLRNPSSEGDEKARFLSHLVTHKAKHRGDKLTWTPSEKTGYVQK